MYRKLNKTVKGKWLRALRSGKYEQADGQLCIEQTDDYGEPNGKIGYCCLGVLAEVSGRLSKDDKGVTFTPDFNNDNTEFRTGCKITPTQKLTRDSSFIPAAWVEPKAQKLLADMNDNGKSFKDIANWISKNL